MAKKLVLWDFDGTLCQTHESIALCMTRTFEHFGAAPPPRSAIDGTTAQGLRLVESLRILRPSLVSADEIGTWVVAYRALYETPEVQARTSLFDGAGEAVAWLAERGVAMAVVSNKGEAAVLTALRRFALLDRIGRVVCDRPGVPRKPDPALFTDHILPYFDGATARTTAVVGDTATDVRFARSIGARACWTAYGYGQEADVLPLAPDTIAPTPASLRATLESMGF